MKLSHTFRHLDTSSALMNFAKDRILAVSRFLLKDGHGHVHYSKLHHEFCVEITINTRERFFKSSAYNSDPYAAVDEAVEKLERQFLKLNKTVKNHKRPELSRRGRLKQLNSRFEFAPRYKRAA